MPTQARQSLNVGLGAARRWRDAHAREDGGGDSLAAELPPESGRVYLWK